MTLSDAQQLEIYNAIHNHADEWGPNCLKFINGAPNNPAAVYLVVGPYLLYLDASTYGWMGSPAVKAHDNRSKFWNFPIYPGTADLRGKTPPTADPFATDIDVVLLGAKLSTAVTDAIAGLRIPPLTPEQVEAVVTAMTQAVLAAQPPSFSGKLSITPDVPVPPAPPPTS